ncbi:outer membrane protein transport protein [Methylobacillus arboreus]|uniref:OmpP1/FadL family transporter n=1 Tax=Methylobacillus arboreus TaxID=755170 RepID=UPI001E4F8F1E|nr:outer membrane protein transport protein [Methylobacillus arboreus]MCB5191763.1 outer membrane protein transport protein [Methylobacillus arboreus]
MSPKLMHNTRQHNIRGISILFMAMALPAHATNGFNLIGFGAESTLMGGADVAVARDSSAINTNPAGLAQIRGKVFNGFGSVLRTLDLSHADQFGSDEHASNRYTLLGGGGYAQSLDSIPCGAGVGSFVQGGAGGVFRNINNYHGSQDDFAAKFGIAKIGIGLGCQVTERLALGATIGMTYARIQQSLYRSSQDGIKFADADVIRPNFKIGLQYKLTPALTFGAAYTEKTKLPMSGGSLDLNIGSIVHYDDAKLDGFATPREVALGLAWKPEDDWLLAIKLNWINWSDAINSTKLTAKNPDNPLLPALSVTNRMDWRDQVVVALGLAYDLNTRTTLYAGYNYGKNPIPRTHTTPFVAGILEHHYTAGAAYKLNQEWTFTGGLEYSPVVKVNYNNPDLPVFGNAQLRNEALFLHFMLSRQWQ